MEVMLSKENLPIAHLPADWVSKKLSKSATLKARIGWQGLTTKEYLKFGDYYLVTGTEFFNGVIDWESCFFVDYERYRQDKNIQLNFNDVLVTKDGTIGKVAIVEYLDKPATLNSGVFVIRPIDNSFNPKYFYYVLSSAYFKNFLNKLSAGSTINHLYQKDFVTFEFPAPKKLDEQKAIADALSDADGLIGSLEKLIEKKSQIKQGAMQELLTGKKRLPGFSGEWMNKRLEEMAKIQRGASPRPIESPIWFDENSTVGWVRISDVTNSKMYLNETSQKLSQAGIKNSRPVKKGGLIMSICATIGRPIITLVDVCIHDGFVVFDELKINQTLLYYILKFIEPDWSKHGQTGSQMNLNTGLINRTIIAFPKNDTEQVAISGVLTSMDDELNDLENKLTKAQQLKQGMMQELLTGRIRLI